MARTAVQQVTGCAARDSLYLACSLCAKLDCREFAILFALLEILTLDNSAWRQRPVQRQAAQACLQSSLAKISVHWLRAQGKGEDEDKEFGEVTASEKQLTAEEERHVIRATSFPS